MDSFPVSKTLVSHILKNRVTDLTKESKQDPIKTTVSDPVEIKFNDNVNPNKNGRIRKLNKYERSVNFINKWTGIKTKWAYLSIRMRAVTVIKLILLAAIIGGLIYFGVIALLGACGIGVSAMGAVALGKSLGFSGMKAFLGILTYEGAVFGSLLLVSLGSGFADKIDRKRRNKIKNPEEKLNKKDVGVKNKKGPKKEKPYNKNEEKNKLKHKNPTESDISQYDSLYHVKQVEGAQKQKKSFRSNEGVVQEYSKPDGHTLVYQV